MPRYHFHSVDGARQYDPNGVELPTLVRAREHAMRYAAEVLREGLEDLWRDGQWRVEVTDDNNALLFTIITIAVDAPKPLLKIS